MSVAKIRIGDIVVITTGRDKNNTGSVVKIKDDYVYVNGCNLRKKTVKQDRSQNRSTSGDDSSSNFKMVLAPIHRSNVSLYDINLKTRIKVAVKEVDGKRVRVNKKTGLVIDNNEAKRDE